MTLAQSGFRKWWRLCWPLILVGAVTGLVVWAWGQYRLLESKRSRIVNIGTPFDACSSVGEAGISFVLPGGSYIPSLFIPFHEDVPFSDSYSAVLWYRIVLDGEVFAEDTERIEVTTAELQDLHWRLSAFPEHADLNLFLSWPSLSYPWDAMARSEVSGVLWRFGPPIGGSDPVFTGRIDIRLESASGMPTEYCEWQLRVDVYWDI